MERSVEAHFTFTFAENQLRKKNFGILGTITPEGRPHSVGVVYAVGAQDRSFCLSLITRPVLKKVRNIRNNPDV